MAAVYDDVEIEDMDFDEEKKTYYFPCPCGDKFFITLVGACVLLSGGRGGTGAFSPWWATVERRAVPRPRSPLSRVIGVASPSV